MKRSRKSVALGSAVLVLAGFVNLFAESVYNVQPQKYVSDAQSEGVGENILAFPNTSSAMMVNPSATAVIYQTRLSLMNVTYPQNVNYRAATMQFPTRYGNFGGGVSLLSYSDDVVYTIAGKATALSNSGDMTVVLNYALPLQRNIPYPEEYGSVGINIKYMHTSMGDYATNGVGVDVGGSYRIPFVNNLSGGLVCRNLGSSMKFANDQISLASSIETGLRYDIPSLGNSAFFAGVGRDITNNVSLLSGGIAVSPVFPFTFRVGWKDSGTLIGSGFRGGIGLDFGTVSLAYAYAPYSRESGMVHYAGIDVGFGGIGNENKAYDHYLRYYFGRAKDKYDRRDFIGARQELEDILSVYPGNDIAKEYLEKIGRDLDDIEQMREVEINRWLRRATVALSEKDYVKAFQSYNAALKLDSENVDAIEGLNKLQQIATALREDAERKDNDDQFLPLLNEAVGYYQRGEYITAKEKFQELLSADPENAEAKKFISDIDAQLAKVTAIQINNLFLKGMDLFNKGDNREAMKYFSAVAIAAPDRLDAQDYLAKCQNLLKQEEEKLSSEAATKRQNKVKEEVDSSFQRAVKLYNGGEYEEAIKAFAASREIAARYQFDRYVEESKNYITQSKNAIAEKHFKIGFKYAQNNKLESAAYEYRKALEYNPENGSAKTELDQISAKLAQDYYEQGMKSFSGGDMEKAKELFKKSLYYKPDKVESLRALERIK